ncbi:ribonucleases P/MRP protein subunit POP1-domain-containing protein [Pilobolus umbonatus]|nr:ribonucleases P/MRP protein subunit POP1-domain-containing protein [Pilobolus umbonatus]
MSTNIDEKFTKEKSNNKKRDSDQSLSGKQKRRERHKEIRKIGKDVKVDNILGVLHNKHINCCLYLLCQIKIIASNNLPKISGPIQADKFAQARINEINSMQTAIKKASYALNELAFQSLPRGLRRRTASHNLNRLPARLRAKAAREAATSAPNGQVKRKKMRKIKRPTVIMKEYLRRQKSKKWLETHIWHAKRMKMADIWGYRIASRPNTKSVRVVYRSFTRLSIAHDASYMGCIEVKGSFNDIVSTFNPITDVALPSVGSARYIKGNRTGTTHLYEYRGYPAKLICPFSFLWKPESQDTLWLWIHPSAYNEALTHIKKSILEQNVNVKIKDLRDEILRFDLTGPRSTALLQAILDPIEGDGATKGNLLWNKLKELRSSSSLSAASVLGLIVNDPRLKFPQKVPPRTNNINTQQQREIQQILDRWPDDVAATPIWSDDLRKALYEYKISEYHLNLRRGENVVPGSKLEPMESDSKIPILLIQRGECMANVHTTNKTLHSNEFKEGWSIILPRGWGMPFWKSLVFAGARIAGYEDVRAMSYESGYASFPHDYPGTRAFEAHRQMAKRVLEENWSAKPPAKRVNFSKRGVKYPFECAFESLSKTSHMEIDSEDKQLIARPIYMLLQGEPIIATIVSSENTAQDLQSKLKQLLTTRHLSFDPLLYSLDEMLVKVRLSYIDKGKPLVNGIIYLLRDKDRYEHCITSLISHTAMTLTKRKFRSSAIPNTLSDKDAYSIPDDSDQIGYVTNGNFSLMIGCGFGLGACTVAGLKETQKIDEEQNRSRKMIVLVRNTTSLKCRPAALSLIE